MAWLLLLFIVVPVAELALLIEIGRHVGLPATLALIIVTGAVGAYLARRQGLGVLAQIRNRAAGEIPLGEIVDGVIILLAGAVLMTPGVLTDAFGFFCLVPAGRRVVKRFLRRRFETAVKRGNVVVSVDVGGGGGGTGEPMRDVTPRTAALDSSAEERER